MFHDALRPELADQRGLRPVKYWLRQQAPHCPPQKVLRAAPRHGWNGKEVAQKPRVEEGVPHFELRSCLCHIEPLKQSLPKREVERTVGQRPNGMSRGRLRQKYLQPCAQM